MSDSFFHTDDMLRMIEDASRHIKQYMNDSPRIGIILGTGLGSVINDVEIYATLEYKDIPHFPISTVESHSGKLIIGTLKQKPIIAMQGRFHFYEGYSMQEITFPIRVFKSLGIDTLLVSNACGALNPAYSSAEIMLIDDHINMLGGNPLIGPNINQFGPRFPDMSRPYDKELLTLSEKHAKELGIKVHRGVYVSVSGPNLETRAEYKYLRIIGADVVGMSTVPEVIVARHMNMRVAGFSIITDEGYHEDLQVVTLDDVIHAANRAEPHLVSLLKALVSAI
ncbi:MAG: purine-nucleoside phosphorylase [Ignavibacteriae bacterium]|jgi:purine-nucleoside phosphorylase|nr:purine-nucleoside phosphorylase [Ignavibacteriota bacterium]